LLSFHHFRVNFRYLCHFLYQVQSSFSQNLKQICQEQNCGSSLAWGAGNGAEVRTSESEVRTFGAEVRPVGMEVRTSGAEVRPVGAEVRTSGVGGRTFGLQS
jgi:hypothetical protein